ncbi:hypothetical protein HPB49_010613 [Dermacentor silvarum]|uniref:Uncharacterized protein n=1 Tax=Dermacentor silvarum TaxID=543639 RepID=A0ACB8DZD1_DERSI|nr:hypothetical protein HPB49_010613 [Dermacentor silvarum]
MPNREEESPPDPGAASIPPEQEDMDTHTGLANLQAGKRPRDQTNSLATTQDSSGGDEPTAQNASLRWVGGLVSAMAVTLSAILLDMCQERGPKLHTKVPVTPSEQEPLGPEEGKSPGTSEAGDEVKQSAKNDPNIVDNVDIEPSSTDTTCSDEAYAEEMEVAGVSGSVVKRTRDQTDREDGDLGDPSSEEPPAKSVVTLRPTFRPKPVIPPDRQSAATKLK